MPEQEKRHTPFVPLYREIILAAAARCGAQALGCLCLLAYQTGQHKGWGLDTSLRELAGSCGVSLNTLRPVGAAGASGADRNPDGPALPNPRDFKGIFGGGKRANCIKN